MRYRARRRHTGVSPSSCRMSTRAVTITVASFLDRRSRHAPPQHQRVLARACAVRRRIVAGATRDRRESLGAIKRDRRGIRDTHFEEALLGAEAQRVVEKTAQQRARQAAPRAPRARP